MNHSPKFIVCLYSDANFLALNILENLLSKNCLVNIVCEDAKAWGERTAQIASKNLFSIVNSKDITRKNIFDYAIYCGGFLNKGTALSGFQKMKTEINLSATKTLILFPSEVYESKLFNGAAVNENLAVIYFTDLMGPRIDLKSDLFLPRSVSEAVQKKKLRLSVGEMTYPIFVSDAAKLVTKWLFAFGPYGKQTLVTGDAVSEDVFWSHSQKYLGEISLAYNKKALPRRLPKIIETHLMPCNLSIALQETFKWAVKENIWDAKLSQREVKRGHNKRNRLIWWVILFLVFPAISLLISFLLLFVSYKIFWSGNDKLTKSLLLTADFTSMLAEKESRVFINIPLVNYLYKEIYYVSKVERGVARMAIHAIPAVREGQILFQNILGNQIFNPDEITNRLSVNLELLNRDFTTLNLNLHKNGLEKTLVAGAVSKKIDVGRIAVLLTNGQKFVSRLPKILGGDGPTTYLVLFQNNMELRPTGGFIGSYGILTFNGGRLTDLAVSDVYSADGQLNGHVEPPAAIKEYLGEANWWLRDSNWDPDFPTSAKRAEWFLDKEVGRKVDGVIAIDLYPIRALVGLTGPIFLADFNTDITAENLYEKTQQEVEANFFPGTHKKASFLTALSQNILAELTGFKGKNLVLALRSLYRSLEERHLQIYLHDAASQEMISFLNWDGVVDAKNCGDGCYADLIGLIEANVGVNKANFYIKRGFSLDVALKPGVIERKLTLNLQNTANPALGAVGRYKAYTRLLTPSDAQILGAIMISGGGSKNLPIDIVDTHNHKETGILIDLLPGESVEVQFAWSSQLVGNQPPVSYKADIRKQAGTDADPISISLHINGLKYIDPRFTLTGGGSYVYNTTLAEDIFPRFTW
jgi:hypothetical protein